MKRNYLPLTLLPILLTGCGGINETVYIIQENQEAIRRSTAVVEESIRLAEESNEKIRENLFYLKKMNQRLREEVEESK